MSRKETARGPGRLALAALGVAPAAVLAGLAWPRPEVGAWIFGLAAALFPLVLVAVALGGGARRRRAGRSLALALGLLAVLLGGAMAAILAVTDGGSLEGGGGAWLWGLPLPATLLLFGLWLVPLPVALGLYVWTFDRLGLGDGLDGREGD